jgi:hypothetical protein
MGLRIRWALVGMLLGLILAGIASFALRRAGSVGGIAVTKALDPPAIVHEIQQLNELVSVKYTVQKVVGLEEKKAPFGAEKILLFVQADVLAGIDPSTLVPGDVRISAGRRIEVALPPPKIVHIVIDDKQTKVWDRSITWWTPWVPYNPDLERQARLAAHDVVEQAALEMGILDQARRNAESGIQNLLMTLGAKSVTIRSKVQG